MRRSLSTLLALVACTALLSAPAMACPGWRVRISPPPGATIDAATPIVISGVRISGLAERGPVLWSREDVVPLRVVESGRYHAVLRAQRPLVAGTRYTLALSRTATGLAHGRAVIPFRQARWTAAERTPPACTSFVGPLARVLLFGLLPFLASYGLTAAYLARRRRRLIDAILL